MCPACGSRTTYHGFYPRKIKIGDTRESITILRVKCNSRDCCKTHAVLPDFISPRKHYSGADIEGVIEDFDAGIVVKNINTPADISTVRRWIIEIQDKSKNIAGSLKSLAFVKYGRIKSTLAHTSDAVLGLIFEALTQLPQIESSGLKLGEANIWLSIPNT